MKHIRNSSKSCSLHVHSDITIQHRALSLAIKISDLEINRMYLLGKWFKKEASLESLTQSIWPHVLAFCAGWSTKM